MALTAGAAPTAHAAAGGCADADLIPTKRNVAEVRAATLCLVNAERDAEGLRPLRANKPLQKAATAHSRDMVKRRYFDHVAPDGATMTRRARKARYIKRRSEWSLAENIAWGGGSLATAAEIVDQWMHSPPHRANILASDLRDAGVGIAIGTPAGGSGATYTLGIGRRS